MTLATSSTWFWLRFVWFVFVSPRLMQVREWDLEFLRVLRARNRFISIPISNHFRQLASNHHIWQINVSLGKTCPTLTSDLPEVVRLFKIGRYSEGRRPRCAVIQRWHSSGNRGDMTWKQHTEHLIWAFWFCCFFSSIHFSILGGGKKGREKYPRKPQRIWTQHSDDSQVFGWWMPHCLTVCPHLRDLPTNVIVDSRSTSWSSWITDFKSSLLQNHHIKSNHFN